MWTEKWGAGHEEIRLQRTEEFELTRAEPLGLPWLVWNADDNGALRPDRLRQVANDRRGVSALHTAVKDRRPLTSRRRDKKLARSGSAGQRFQPMKVVKQPPGARPTRRGPVKPSPPLFEGWTHYLQRRSKESNRQRDRRVLIIEQKDFACHGTVNSMNRLTTNDVDREMGGRTRARLPSDPGGHVAYR